MNGHQLLAINCALLAANLVLVVCNWWLLNRIGWRIRQHVAINDALRQTLATVQGVYEDLRKMHEERFPN